MITYRKATAEDVRPALDLALRVFTEYVAPDYEPADAENFKNHCIENKEYTKSLCRGDDLMFVALDGERIVGMVAERYNGEIYLLFVDRSYHRRGIAETLMNNIVCALKLKGHDRITLDSSPYALPFYSKYGFKPTSGAVNNYGCIVTPMEYYPNEIWDVLDKNGNKTGRYHERGRKLAEGDYHFIVHVWKYNKKGEWLIDRRAPQHDNGGFLSGKWETTGGSALAGDDSLTAALREVKEELGIDLDPAKGTLFLHLPRTWKDGHSVFTDVWVFECDEPIEKVVYDENEVCDAKWATVGQIREMIETGEFLGSEFYPYFDELMEKWK